MRRKKKRTKFNAQRYLNSRKTKTILSVFFNENCYKHDGAIISNRNKNSRSRWRSIRYFRQEYTLIIQWESIFVFHSEPNDFRFQMFNRLIFSDFFLIFLNCIQYSTSQYIVLNLHLSVVRNIFSVCTEINQGQELIPSCFRALILAENIVHVFP